MNTQTMKDIREAFEEGYAKGYIACKEALAQPAQGITEGSQLSNLKVSSKSEKPFPPPAPIHTCTYSRTMNQEYPRKCTHCGEVEAKTQPAQEPGAWESLSFDEINGLCEKYWDGPKGYSVLDIIEMAEHILKRKNTHPAPSWQGLSDSDFHEAHDIEFRRGAAWAEQILEEKNKAITPAS